MDTFPILSDQRPHACLSPHTRHIFATFRHTCCCFYKTNRSAIIFEKSHFYLRKFKLGRHILCRVVKIEFVEVHSFNQLISAFRLEAGHIFVTECPIGVKIATHYSCNQSMCQVNYLNRKRIRVWTKIPGSNSICN